MNVATMTSSNDLDFMVRRTCQKQAMVSGCHESKPSSGSSSTPNVIPILLSEPEKLASAQPPMHIDLARRLVEGRVAPHEPARLRSWVCVCALGRKKRREGALGEQARARRHPRGGCQRRCRLFVSQAPLEVR